MTIPETDNRIQLPPTLIDFEDEVGVTGQDHDDFPDAGQQPRYDWMRLFLIGLLSHQSSEDKPTQFRTGTTHYDRARSAYEYYNGTTWRDIANAIILEEDSDDALTLAEWFTIATEQLSSIRPKIVWSGNVSANDITLIPIPNSAKDEIEGLCDDLHPVVYQNGLQIDPRNTRFATSCPSSVELLNGEELNDGDRYTVVVEKIDLLVPGDVNIP
jgi:hypothetical protein